MANVTTTATPLVFINESSDQFYNALAKYTMSYVVFGTMVIVEILWLHITRYFPWLRHFWPLSILDYLVNLCLLVHVGIVFYLDPNQGVTIRTALVAIAFSLAGIMVLNGVITLAIFLRRSHSVGVIKAGHTFLEVNLDGKTKNIDLPFLPVTIAVTKIKHKGKPAVELGYTGERVVGTIRSADFRAMKGMLATSYTRKSVVASPTGLVTDIYVMQDPHELKGVFGVDSTSTLPV